MNKFTGRKGTFSHLTALMNNRDFPPGMKSAGFFHWYGEGLRLIGDLFDDDNNVLMSFTHVRNTFGLPKKDCSA